MNDILNRGFVSPLIFFQFSNGNTLDTIPPRYFESFSQDRTTDKAATFTLNLVYCPDSISDSQTTTIHNLLLSCVKQQVVYKYGYITPGGGHVMQDQAYKGTFLEYAETMNEGYLSYTIKGIASAVETGNITVSIQDYLTRIKKQMKKVQPSRMVEALVTGNGINAETSAIEISKYFQNFDLHIDHTDDEIALSSINIPDGTLHDIFIGKSNQDNTSLPTGFKYYSQRVRDDAELITHGYLTDRIVSMYEAYKTLNVHASSSITPEMENAYNYYINTISSVRTVTYECYFDNVIPDVGSPQIGSFYYIEKDNRQPTDVFNYNFGNNFIDSDVLSFSADVDYTAAIATVKSLGYVGSNIDVDGQNSGGSFLTGQTEGFVKNTYSTLSGFDESAFLTRSMLSDVFNFPFEATMTVIGQTECNHLLDIIRVNVFVNGVEHPFLTGNYTILEIEDSINSNGFTTTFKLVKQLDKVSEEPTPTYVGNTTDSIAYQNQLLLDKT